MNNQFNHNKKNFIGFSIIELMVVVAIIGILASIATPIYLNYTIKSHVSSALTVLEGAKNKIIEEYINNNSFPNNNNLVQYSDNLIASISLYNTFPTSGACKDAIIKSNNNDTNTSTGFLGYIEATFINATANTRAKLPAQLEGQCIALVAFENTNAITWKCASNIADSYLPNACK